MVDTLKERARTLVEMAEQAAFYLRAPDAYDPPSTAKFWKEQAAERYAILIKRLEAQVEKWEGKYHDQVRRTEDIQLKSQERLVELQRMTTIGQSKTLADFMLQAKNWIVGGTSDDSTATTGIADDKVG